MNFENVPERRTRDLKHGLLLRRTGQILVFAGPLGVAVLLGLLATLFPSLQDGVLSYLLLFVMLPLLMFFSVFLAYRVMWRGKQYSARAKAAKADIRQPVLYLRPFTIDEGIGGLFRSALFRGLVGPWFSSVEEQLADAVEPIGPLVGIGRPGEELPNPGAVRQYFADTEWRNAVRQLLSKARVIIVRPGFSEGLWWELNEAVTGKNSERLLILMLNTNWADYDNFSQLLKDKVDIRLPDFKQVSGRRRVSGLFEFNEGWEARFLPLKKAPFLRIDPDMPLTAAFNHTLQPLFARLGVSWRPSPFSRFTLILIITIALGVIIFLISYLTDLVT